MDITVCLCTHNRPGYLADCLAALRQQTVGAASFDILVVDSASGREVAAQIVRLVAAMGNARLLRVDRPGISRARTAGADTVWDGYLAYIDDDAIPAPDWIAAIQAALAGPDP